MLSELCQRGFALFGQRLQTAAGAGASSAEALSRMGPAYLRFAREEPGYYAAMFAFHGAGTAAPEPARPGPFAILAQAVASQLPEGGRAPRLVALQVWALSHGVAMLERAGMPIHGDGAPPPEVVLENGVAALLGRQGVGDAALGTGPRGRSRLELPKIPLRSLAGIPMIPPDRRFSTLPRQSRGGTSGRVNGIDRQS
ncbi:TetR-like C-terminal domain-containing protein [Siccirubricoccus deserti]